MELGGYAPRRASDGSRGRRWAAGGEVTPGRWRTCAGSTDGIWGNPAWSGQWAPLGRWADPGPSARGTLAPPSHRARAWAHRRITARHHEQPPDLSCAAPAYRTMSLVYTSYDNSKATFTQIADAIAEHLSEPYSIFVYWYFLHKFPQYCFLVRSGEKLVGVIVSRVDVHRDVRVRGYIGMLVIHPEYRHRQIASGLVKKTIAQMISDGVDEISLETETTNVGALRLYEGLGFVKTKRLYRYYLNSSDAFRLTMPVTERALKRIAFLPHIDSIH